MNLNDLLITYERLSRYQKKKENNELDIDDLEEIKKTIKFLDFASKKYLELQMEFSSLINNEKDNKKSR